MINLQDFCAKDNRICAFSTPFVRSGWKYASDSKIIIRIKTDELDCGAEGMTVSTLEKVMGIKDCPEHAKPWPNSDGKTKSKKCEGCRGSGMSGATECKKCLGTGIIECSHCGSEIDCDECDGEGIISDPKSPPCPECGGKGEMESMADQCLGGKLTIRGEYFTLISQLPNVRYIHAEQYKIRFFFDGGDGAVMGLKKWEDVIK